MFQISRYFCSSMTLDQTPLAFQFHGRFIGISHPFWVLNRLDQSVLKVSEGPLWSRTPRDTVLKVCDRLEGSVKNEPLHVLGSFSKITCHSDDVPKYPNTVGVGGI